MPKIRGILSTDNESKPFLDHLEDLRKMLLRCLAALAAGLIVTIHFTPRILRILTAPLKGVTDNPEQFLHSLDVTGAFSVALQIAFWSALVVASPFLVVFILLFILPGLTPRERKAVGYVSVAAIFLFCLGVCLGYFITMPVALQFMFRVHGWLGVDARWTVTSYTAFSTQLLAGFGLAFELPALLFILGYLGIISSAMLKAGRKHAIVIILVLSMFLTPSDVFSMLIMAVPLMLLYEACIVAIRWIGR